MTCKDCIHYKVCCQKPLHVVTGMDFVYRYKYNQIERVCKDFKDRSRFVELPCKIGTELFRIKQINGKRFITNTALNSNTFWNIVMQGEFGKTVFLTREEAEQALKERENNA